MALCGQHHSEPSCAASSAWKDTQEQFILGTQRGQGHVFFGMARSFLC